MKKSFILFIVASALSFSSCTEDPPPTTQSNDDDNKDPVLTEFYEINGKRVEGTDFTDRTIDFEKDAPFFDWAFTVGWDYSGTIPTQDFKIEFEDTVEQDFVIKEFFNGDNDTWVYSYGYVNAAPRYTNLKYPLECTYDHMKMYKNNNKWVVDIKNLVLFNLKDSTDEATISALLFLEE